jgi:hypothetical protein
LGGNVSSLSVDVAVAFNSVVGEEEKLVVVFDDEEIEDGDDDGEKANDC